ncbi:unnamed protein product [Rotaria sordida]|uniref:Uncharacterized protein n=1 Tax=Rotaria sordida TaxID=392033 RepID=A0A815SV07_9BILA|nr:unnamed protein product [Rotaria sordida]
MKLTNQNPITNTIRSTKPSVKLIRTCGSLLPLQTVIQSKEESTSIIEPISTTTTTNEIDSNNKLSTDNFNKESKRSRFQLKETFQRNKSMCVNHFQTWFQRRQHPHSCKIRRKSIIKSKDETSCLTPIFHSPRLFRLHERIFKHQSQPLQQIVHISKPLETLDDSDNQSQYELPVRIYFPPLTTPIPRHVRNTHIDIVKSTNDNHDMNIEQTFNHSITPITNRKDSFSFQLTTAKKRRESFATLSNIINSRCL